MDGFDERGLSCAGDVWWVSRRWMELQLMEFHWSSTSDLNTLQQIPHLQSCICSHRCSLQKSTTVPSLKHHVVPCGSLLFEVYKCDWLTNKFQKVQLNYRGILEEYAMVLLWCFLQVPYYSITVVFWTYCIPWYYRGSLGIYHNGINMVFLCTMVLECYFWLTPWYYCGSLDIYHGIFHVYHGIIMIV